MIPTETGHSSEQSMAIAEFWQHPLKAAHCPKCERTHLIPDGLSPARCPSCFQALLDSQPTLDLSEPPESILEYTITPAQAKSLFENWLKGIWLRPKELQAEILASRLTPLFIPMWLVDCTLSGNWQAQMGFDYEVASSQEIFRNNSWNTRKLTETRINWEPRLGQIKRTYNNLAVPALEDHAQREKELGAFKLDSVKPFSPGALQMASVLVPNLPHQSAWPLAQSGLNHSAAEDCRKASSAQHVDEYSIDAAYENANWTLLLLPTYSTAYRDHQGIIHTIRLNGQTGKIDGLRVASRKAALNWGLVLAAIAFASLLLAVLAGLGTLLLPAVGILSIIFFVVFLFFGISATIPSIWVWNYNRSEKR